MQDQAAQSQKTKKLVLKKLSLCQLTSHGQDHMSPGPTAIDCSVTC